MDFSSEKFLDSRTLPTSNFPTKVLEETLSNPLQLHPIASKDEEK